MAYEYSEDSNATFGNNTFVDDISYGDTAGTLYGFGQGGDDLLIGMNNPQYWNRLRGDANSLTDNATGGNDTLIAGSNAANYLWGESSYMFQSAVGGDDSLVGGANSTNRLYGDADSMWDTSLGGNDTLIGGASSTNFAYGEGYYLFLSVICGNDLILGGNISENYLAGDAAQVFNNVHCGNDTIIGGAQALNVLVGDAFAMDHATVGGNDKLIGGAASDNQMFGDTYRTQRSEVLGNDSLYGANGATNTMYGDAFAMVYNSVAGNDLLVAGNGGINRLVGDAETVTRDIFLAGSGIVLGNDTLVGGTSQDDMWGDYVTKIDNGPVLRGSDVFVFSEHCGIDTVHDFTRGEDKIDLSAILLTSAHVNSHMMSHIPPQALANILSNPRNLTGFAYLDSNSDGVLNGSDTFVHVAGGKLILDLGAANHSAADVDLIALMGVEALTAGDFIL